MMARSAEPTLSREGPAFVIAQIARLAFEVTAGADPVAIRGAGICSPGPLDTTEGIALGIPTLAGFDDYPLHRSLADALNMPVVLENDGICAAIGEWRMGAAKGHDNVVYVTVSTGIGGGVIADGRVLRGRRGMAGHVGHMCLVMDGEPCPCGARGCFEAYASGTALARRARAALGSTADASSVFEEAARGNSLAMDLVREEARYLGQGFASLLHLYNPDILVLGGGLSNRFDMLRDGILAEIRQTAMPAFRDTPVVKAALGGESGLIGAASLVFDQHVDEFS
jgi:glucokinase